MTHSNFVDDILKNCNILRTRAREAEASLADAEALTKRNAELMNGYLSRIDELETGLDEAVKVVRQNAGTISALRVQIAELEAQVAALQEIAVEQKAMRICTIPANWWNEGEQVKEYFRASARDQLRREHPEAFR